MTDFAQLRREWRGEVRGADWPSSGVAIEGDFAGIQRFVLKPVPGVKGAAKRLRGRSLLVVALTQSIADRVAQAFRGRVFYQAGGRFLVVSNDSDGWAARLRQIQEQLDHWFLAQFRGETQFHLAGAEIQGEAIPRDALAARMRERRQRPLGEALAPGGKWSPKAFFPGDPGERAFRCPACLSTSDDPRLQKDEEDEEICPDCDRDKRIGEKLAIARNPHLVKAADGEIALLDERYTLAGRGAAGAKRLDVIHHLPRHGNDIWTLEDVAEASCGSRKWLAYLRIDADGIGAQFRELGNDPYRVRGLSRLLQHFFCDEVQALIERQFPTIYAVYGGGDDLFVIGPWDQALAFAQELRAQFKAASDGKLTFSAGIALSKPRQHILIKSEEAEGELKQAKDAGRDRIRVLNETVVWHEFPAIRQSAEKVARWHNAGQLSSAFLHAAAGLWREWKGGSDRYRALLHYQIERNVKGSRSDPLALDWARRLMEPGSAEWLRMDWTVRYAVLARRPQGMSGDGKGERQ